MCHPKCRQMKHNNTVIIMIIINLKAREFLKHRYLHALAKLATAEGIELRSLSV